MPNPEASNSNQAGSDSTLGGRTTGKDGGQNPFEELTKLPEFGEHMAKMQDAHDIVSYKFVDEAGNAIGKLKFKTDYEVGPDMAIKRPKQMEDIDFPPPTPEPKDQTEADENSGAAASIVTPEKQERQLTEEPTADETHPYNSETSTYDYTPAELLNPPHTSNESPGEPDDYIHPKNEMS